jgi:trimeric autotransporter adhesin
MNKTLITMGILLWAGSSRGQPNWGEAPDSANLVWTTGGSAQSTNAGSSGPVLSDASDAVTNPLATLPLLVRPAITAQPQSQTVAAGADVAFSVSASGTLPISYRWRRGSTTLTNMILNEYTSTYSIPYVQATNAGTYTVYLTNLAGPAPLSSNAVLTVVFPVVRESASIAAESCSPANGAIDPGETVTVVFGLLNTNAPTTSNLVATLLEGGGVVSPSGPQLYEGLIPGGPPVARPFTFTANGPCGGTVNARLRLQDGTMDLGAVTFSFRLGPTNTSCCLDAGAADLALSLSGSPDPAVSGDLLTYTLWVTNGGPAAATGVSVTNFLPSSASFLSATSSQGACTNIGTMVVCALGSLARNAAAVITTVVRPGLTGMVLSAASVTAFEPDFNAANNQSTTVTTIAEPVQTRRFSNTNSIVIPNDISCDGPAAPYPSAIAVSGMRGTITKVTVTLSNFWYVSSINGLAEVDMLLVGPSGQAVIVMSDAGGFWSLYPVEALTFDDAAPGYLPDAWAIVSGSYKPTEYESGDYFPAPAPMSPYATVLSAFNETDPNGTWRLFVVEDEPSWIQCMQGGMDSGWSLTLTTESALSVLIDDASAAEGNAGTRQMQFPVRLSRASTQTTQVDYATADGTAAAGSDYVATAGTLVFPPGIRTQSLSVTIKGDTTFEADETFFVNLSNPRNAQIRDGQGAGTILNDEFLPTITAQPLSQTVDQGSTVGFMVVATGSAPLSYQWYFNGGALPGATLPTLTLVNVQGTNTGRYRVVVSNFLGSTPSWEARLTVVFPSPPELQPSDVPREEFWHPDGPVYAIVETNGVVYVGGQFSSVLDNGGKGALLDLSSGLADPQFPKFNGAITASVSDGNGGFYIAGQFTSVGGAGRSNLVHILSDRSVDPVWTPTVDGTIGALLLCSNALYAGGTFTNANGQPRRCVAAFDAGTGELTPWNPDAHAFPEPVNPLPTVYALAALGNQIYVGGWFNTLGRQPRSSLAAVNLSNGDATSFRAEVLDQPMVNGGYVYALAVWENRLYVAGYFDEVGGQARNNLAAVDALTGRSLPWNPGVNGDIYAMVTRCQTLYLAGSFAHVGGQARNCLAAVDAVSGAVEAWNPGANGSVMTLALAGHVLYVGGYFTSLGGQSHEYLGAVDAVTGTPLLWNPTTDRDVNTLALSGNHVFAGGQFSRGGVARRNLAAFDAHTGRPLAWDPSPNGAVSALAISGNTLYIAGGFSTIAGQARQRLAAFDEVTGSLQPWAPGADGSVGTLAISGNTVYVGGDFGRIAGQSRSCLAAVDATTGVATAWNPGVSRSWNIGGSLVASLAAAGDVVYACGAFDRLDGADRQWIGAVDAITGSATAWNLNTNAWHNLNEDGGYGTALAVTPSTVYFGGSFGSPPHVAEQSRWGLAAGDTICGILTPWNPTAVDHSGLYFSLEVNALAVSSNAVYAGGAFGEVGGQPRNNLAALSRTGSGRALAWNPNCDGNVYALAVSGKQVYAGGGFATVGGRYQPHLAAFPVAGAPRLIVPPVGQVLFTGQSHTLSVRASGNEPLFYQWQMNWTNLPGATNSTFTIAQAQVTDSGSYSVIVSNQYGSASSFDATLIVVVPVTITAQPVSLTAAPGANIILSVTATGSPPPTYQWRLNGVNIPGANSATFTITNAQPTDGGSYDVVVANEGGAISSDVAVVVITSPALPFADNLIDRGSNSTASGVGSGTNVGATREPGEPHHAGKLGGRSVWLSWVAPSNGIATFSTRGSSFDTLLAIYTGTEVSGLTPVADDDDRGGFLTSQASFNATNGMEYLIVVDGFAGASGNLVLSWSLDTSTGPFPRIITQPLSLTVLAGQNAIFSVAVSSATSESYQWYSGCAPIPGATNATLVISNVQPRDVGNYYVVVINASARAAWSTEAYLEIGPELKFVSQDKLEDLFPEWLGGEGADQPRTRSPPGSVAQGYISVALGSIDSQLLNNAGASTQPGEPLPCGVLGGASKWLRLRAESNGVFVIDTIGSAIDTVLAVYYSTNLLRLSSALLACDDNGAPDGIRSRVQFTNAVPGTDYLVVADGVNGAQGAINLNWKLGRPPAPVAIQPKSVTLSDGTMVLEVLIINAVPLPRYQWFLNGVKIAGATNSVLRLPSGHCALGIYSVQARNFAGSVFLTNAVLVELACEAHLQNGVLRLRLPAGLTQPVWLESSFNLADWRTQQVIYPLQSCTVDVPQTSGPAQFLRLRPGPGPSH